MSKVNYDLRDVVKALKDAGILAHEDMESVPYPDLRPHGIGYWTENEEAFLEEDDCGFVPELPVLRDASEFVGGGYMQAISPVRVQKPN